MARGEGTGSDTERIDGFLESAGKAGFKVRQEA